LACFTEPDLRLKAPVSRPSSASSPAPPQTPRPRIEFSAGRGSTPRDRSFSSWSARNGSMAARAQDARNEHLDGQHADLAPHADPDAAPPPVGLSHERDARRGLSTASTFSDDIARLGIPLDLGSSNGEHRTQPPRREGRGLPAVAERSDHQRREFREALLDADAFEDLPGRSPRDRSAAHGAQARSPGARKSGCPSEATSDDGLDRRGAPCQRG
jgi:hypothetical protein